MHPSAAEATSIPQPLAGRRPAPQGRPGWGLVMGNRRWGLRGDAISAA